MASPVLGIDLGTTNSVVAVANPERVHVLPDEEGRLLTPSVVSFHPSGEVLVGAAAVERKLVDAAHTIASIKRLIGRPFRSPEVRQAAERFAFELGEGKTGGVIVRARGEDYSLPEISAFVLRRLKATAEKALHAGCSSAVVTVPANFNELQRTATRDAARIAGLNVLRILNEPTAAALAYGYGARSRKRIAVYDLGGGTFDVSILDMSGDVIEVIATAGDTYLGGDDVDNAIADAMAQRFLRENRIDLRGDGQAYERLRMAAEWLKCELSSRFAADATLEEIAFDGRGRAINYSFELTRDKLQQLAFPLIGRTFDICEEALQVAGLRPPQLDGVVLVGGQTRSPQVRQMVAEYFGCEPQTSVDPDQVVAQGAALQALALSGQATRSRTPTHSGHPPGPGTASEGPVGPQMPPPPSFFAQDPEPSGFDDEPTVVANRSTPDPPSAAAAVAVPRAVPLPPPPAGAAVPPPPPAGAAAARPAPPPPSPVEPPAPPASPLAAAAADVQPNRKPGFSTLTGVGGREGEVKEGAPRLGPASPSARVDETEVMRLQPTSAPPDSNLGALELGQGAAAPGEAIGADSPSASLDEEELPYALRTPDEPSAPRSAAEAGTAALRPGSEGPGSETPGDGSGAFDVHISSGPPPSAAASRAAQGPPAPAPFQGLSGQAQEVPSLLADHVQKRSSKPPAKTVVGVANGPAVAEAAVAAAVSPGVPAPLLLDVTPRALAIETAGGFCEQIVQRNSPIPTEQSRVFSTSQDNQVKVSMRVCQGEARRTDDNEVLGALELLGLREAPRGKVRIGVTFIIDADGMLRARAQDRTTGKSQEIRINLVGALEDEEIERMRRRQDAMLGS